MKTTTLSAAEMRRLKQPDVSYSKAYAELKRLAKEKGLLEKQPAYYIYALLEPLILLGIGVAVLLLVDAFWVQLINALYLAVVFVRVGFVMHDAGHRQIFKKTRRNDLVGLIYGNLLLGSSISSWRERHNEHHAHTNELDADPTLEIPLWAWIEEQVQEQKGLLRFIMKYQAFTFFPVLSLSAFFQAFAAIRYVLMEKKVEDRAWQGLLLALHFVLYFGLVFYALPWWQAVIFLLVNHLALGLHLGLVFAPNHKGMPLVEKDHQMDFLYVQALTTRNVRPGPVVDYLYGGLNYQIEHHLFPGMPRNKLGEARRIVKAFCEERDIPYYETGPIRSYREILQYMHQVGAPLRRSDRLVRATEPQNP
ncbi:MAG TPA: acyl-CoA desaturase [Chloroflexi bacterium]|nr:acyl-CoA desaturase [Chloroflexota bacterium]